MKGLGSCKEHLREGIEKPIERVCSVAILCSNCSSEHLSELSHFILK